MSGLDNKKDFHSVTGKAEVKGLRISPILTLRINPNFVRYITESIIVFVSGCNVILYNFSTNEQKFIPRKSKQNKITYLSVGTAQSRQKFSMNKTQTLMNFYSGQSKDKDKEKSQTKMDFYSPKRPDLQREKFRTKVNFFKSRKKNETDIINNNDNNNNNNNNKAQIRGSIFGANQKNEIKEKIICIGEYSESEDCFYITTIQLLNKTLEYSIKSTEKYWQINYCTVLSGTNYCVALSRKSNQTLSRISFAKYSMECFVCQETIPEELIYCCYNPKNTIELVICGKGYLRLWNVFINEGALKEHQTRFLKGKQEKERTFIKAQFFDKKPFLLIVGTLENMFYIIESDTVIYELNVCYSNENIYDLNVQNLQGLEENDDIGNLQENINSLTKKDIDIKLKEISALTNTPRKKREFYEGGSSESIVRGTGNDNSKEKGGGEDEEDDKKDVFKRLYKNKNVKENDAKINKNNRVKYFELLSDNLLFIIYAKDGCTMFYKIDWNRKIQDDEKEEDFKKWKASECRIIRIAKNIKQVIGYSMCSPSNDIILVVESYQHEDKSKNITDTSLFKMETILIKEKKQESYMINFQKELFNGFFDETPIKILDLCEKKLLVYYVDNNNTLYCFDILKSKYFFRKFFKQEILSISVNQKNHLIAISFEDKVIIFGNFRGELKKCCELEVSESVVSWSIKGDKLVIGGNNRNPNKKNTYCLYFLEGKEFNTINVFENLIHKIKEIRWLDDDNYLFTLSTDSYIMGLNIKLGDCSYAFHELYAKDKERSDSLVSHHFELIYTHNPRGRNYTVFDYDSRLKVILALDTEKNKLYVVSNVNIQEKKYDVYFELSCNLRTVKLVKELNVLLGGDSNGAIKIYQWPFKGYFQNEIKSIGDSLKNSIKLDLGYISKLLTYKNYASFITLTSYSYLFINVLLMSKNDPRGGDPYKLIEYFSKPYKPQIELYIPPYDMYIMQCEEIDRKEKNVEILIDAMDKLKRIMSEDIKDIEKTHNSEIKNMENNLKQNTESEKKKLENIVNDIENIKRDMDSDTKKRIEEMEKDKKNARKKYDDKITLYENEIGRLKEELQSIKESIKSKYETEAKEQEEFYAKTITEYNNKFNQLKNETEKSLLQLVSKNSEYDEANEKIINDYEKLIKNLDNKIELTTKQNEEILKEAKEKLIAEKKKEDKHKQDLDKVVDDSDKLIQKNVEVKQNIINATQRTITFQEQLLETEKNLVKIDKKLEDLVVKNKHLEQIRFVLEHRMTSLEKEKSPLEGQCSFLENQKNKLTDEFNNIILQINTNNQKLENNQSELRASLIQNYEVNDQVKYVKNKLAQLKNDIEQFLATYQEEDENTSIKENKATYVALNFKKFYDKYFSTSIEDELAKYQYYSQKLQEQTDKDGIANNFDLIMRNKAEEKLICEKLKVEELVDVREKGFRRIQNENTILITECNRLRKNLHEIYMHVIDIEQRFEALTKINPKLSKDQIVTQIKEFIKITHEKIKANYAKTKKSLPSNLSGSNLGSLSGGVTKKNNKYKKNRKNSHVVINTENNYGNDGNNKGGVKGMNMTTTAGFNRGGKKKSSNNFINIDNRNNRNMKNIENRKDDGIKNKNRLDVRIKTEAATSDYANIIKFPADYKGKDNSSFFSNNKPYPFEQSGVLTSKNNNINIDKNMLPFIDK